MHAGGQRLRVKPAMTGGSSVYTYEHRVKSTYATSGTLYPLTGSPKWHRHFGAPVHSPGRMEQGLCRAVVVCKLASCTSIVQYRKGAYRKSTIFIMGKRHRDIPEAVFSVFRAESYIFEAIVCNSLHYIFASSDGCLIRDVATPVFMN